jgi:hypothetical protein
MLLLYGHGEIYSYGALGDGTNINKTIPTQIGTDTNWQYIFLV